MPTSSGNTLHTSFLLSGQRAPSPDCPYSIAAARVQKQQTHDGTRISNSLLTKDRAKPQNLDQQTDVIRPKKNCCPREYTTVLAEDIGPGDRNFSNLREEQRKSTKASRQTCTVRKPRQNLCSSSSKDRRSGCCGAAKIAVAARTLNSVDLTRRTTGWNLTGFFLPSFADGATFIRERGIPGACSVHRTVPLIRTLLGKGGHI